jgi:hypothetical protein
MILLVTLAPSAPDCASRLQQSTGEPVTIATGFSDAVAHLRTADVSLVIIDRNLMEAEPHEASTLWAHLESTIVVDLNLALTGLDRLILEVQAVRKRFQHNHAVARDRAARSLQSEINQTLNALLLDCDLAAQITDLPSSAGERIAAIRTDAESLRRQLVPPSTN